MDNPSEGVGFSMPGPKSGAEFSRDNFGKVPDSSGEKLLLHLALPSLRCCRRPTPDTTRSVPPSSGVLPYAVFVR